MYTFFETPQWASSDPTKSCSATQNLGVYGCAAPPKNINDWNRFVTALVTKYKGEIQYFEPWNEPDVPTEYSGNITEMVTLAESAYNIIKSIDPSAIVLTPSVSIGGVLSSNPNCGSSLCWLASYLAAGGGKYADGFDFHGKACDSGTGICVSNNIACPGNAIQECAGTPLIDQINDVRTIMSNNGLSDLPIINTEGGYTTEVATNDLSNATADQQAAFVSRFFIIQASENLQIAVWFSWFGNVKGFSFTGFGTTAAEAVNNQAYKETYDWLVGSTMNGPCSEGSNSVWMCTLTLSSGEAGLIVWSDSATSYTPSGTYSSYQNINGTIASVSGAIPIGNLPVLLTSSSVASSTTLTSSVSSIHTTSATSTLTSVKSSTTSSITSSSIASSSSSSTVSSVGVSSSTSVQSTSPSSTTSITSSTPASTVSGSTSAVWLLLVLSVVVVAAVVVLVRVRKRV
ncbi:MAG: hypothetical protein ABSE82_03550 [Nitrososphaerales archaeon]|jgi:hypothetical protein